MVQVALCLVVIAAALGWWQGRSGAMEKFDVYKAVQAAQAAQRKAENVVVTERVVVQYRDRIVRVKEKSDDIEKSLPTVSGSCPGAVGVLHDAAALQTIPAGRTDDAGTDAQTLAATFLENYSACHANAEQLTALQNWVREIK